MSKQPNNEWFADGLRFECTQCGNCCTGPPGFVWFTDEEGAALAAHLGISVDEFRQRYAFVLKGQWSLAEVKRNGKYDCVFLSRTDDGRALCTVYPVRPQQCRTWPFWPENIKSHAAWRRAAKTCPGIDTGALYPVENIRIIRDSNPPDGPLTR